MFAAAGRPVVGEENGNRDDESEQPKDTSSSVWVGASVQTAIIGGRTTEGAVIEYRRVALLHGTYWQGLRYEKPVAER